MPIPSSDIDPYTEAYFDDLTGPPRRRCNNTLRGLASLPVAIRAG